MMAPPSLIKLCDFLENSRKTWLCCRTMKRTLPKSLALKQLKHKWRLSSPEKRSLQASRLVASAATHPVSSCRLLPACLLSPPCLSRTQTVTYHTTPRNICKTSRQALSSPGIPRRSEVGVYKMNSTEKRKQTPRCRRCT